MTKASLCTYSMRIRCFFVPSFRVCFLFFFFFTNIQMLSFTIFCFSCFCFLTVKLKMAKNDQFIIFQILEILYICDGVFLDARVTFNKMYRQLVFSIVLPTFSRSMSKLTNSKLTCTLFEYKLINIIVYYF